MIDLDLRSCELCPRLCRVNREEKPGACGCSARLLAARAALHFGEEPCISGAEGSGTVFFSGCNLHCVFCQNHKISRERYGRELRAERLADIFRELEAKGANNINLVTPTPWVTEIIKALELYRPQIPVLYNTSGYERVEVLRALEAWSMSGCRTTSTRTQRSRRASRARQTTRKSQGRQYGRCTGRAGI